MTELMEMIAAPVPGKELECPLPHEEKEWPAYENVFQGDGGKLGDKMESGDQTIINKEMGGGKKIDVVLRPAKDPDSEYRLKMDRPIKLGGLLANEETFPLTCAAHHLIPAQASLKESELVKYLYEGTAKFYHSGKTVTKGGGKLVANVGYDVNGGQNGVWLPGPYALRKVVLPGMPKPEKGKKRKSTVREMKKRREEITVKVAVPAEFIEDPDSEDHPPEGLDLADMPQGTAAVGMKKVTVSYYFLYCIAAMRMVGAQYHDAHSKYNEFVLACLNKIAAEIHAFGYNKWCDKCPERSDKDKLPPPYALVERLNLVSSRLRDYLVGDPISWESEIFTSSICLEFMKDDFKMLTLGDVEKI